MKTRGGVNANETETVEKGEWWVPDDPSRKVTGQLTYSPTGGAELDLFGYFFDDIDDSFNREFVVWGETTSQEHVTLFKCHTMNVKGGVQAKISSYYGVVGGHFGSLSEMKFDRVSAANTDLNTWTGTTGIHVRHDTKNNTNMITVGCRAVIRLGEIDGVMADLDFYSTPSISFGEFAVKEGCKISLSSSEPLPYESFEKIARKLRHFFTLGLGRPVYQLSISGYLHDSHLMGESFSADKECQIILKEEAGGPPEKPLRVAEMLFSLSDLMPQPEKYLGNYTSKYEKLRAVYQLYLSTLYQPDMFLEQRFLSLAYAVEAYHRALVGGKYQSDEEYEYNLMQILLRAIPADLNPAFKESLKGKLKYLNEFSLRKRVNDVYERHEDVLSHYLDEAKMFGARIADTRNDLTHSISSGEGDRDWLELLLMSEQLSLLILACLMDEIGLPKNKIASIVNRCRHAQIIRFNRK